VKRFTFRLQSILNYRQYLERLAQQETAKAYQNVVQAEQHIAALKNDLHNTGRELDRVSSEGMSAVQFKAYQDYLDAVDAEIALQTARREDLKKQLVKKQKDLTKRSIARKVMERLKEKKQRRYLDDMLKWEQSILDETVSVKKAREVNNGTT